MIKLSNVSREYRSGTSTVFALRDVTLDVTSGEFVTITGPSGCGKSTLLNLLGGLDTPTSGQLTVDGIPLHTAGDTELTRYRRYHLGIVFQFFNLLPAMTLAENVEVPLLLQGQSGKRRRERAMELLDLVGLAGRAGHFPHQLSGGELQRGAIARALIHEPALLLADEPTGNLDSANAAHVVETLRKIASKRLTTMIIVTHSAEMAQLAPRTVQMKDGTIFHD